MNRQTHQQRSYLLSIPRMKKRGFCHCSAPSQNIRMAHCEGEEQKDLCTNYLPNQSMCTALGLYIPLGRTQYKLSAATWDTQ